VRRRVVGRAHLCRIELRPLADASGWLDNCRRVWEDNFARLDSLLRELQTEEAKPGHTKG
jgi:hypothetical protein